MAIDRVLLFLHQIGPAQLVDSSLEGASLVIPMIYGTSQLNEPGAEVETPLTVADRVFDLPKFSVDSPELASRLLDVGGVEPGRFQVSPEQLQLFAHVSALCLATDAFCFELQNRDLVNELAYAHTHGNCCHIASPGESMCQPTRGNKSQSRRESFLVDLGMAKPAASVGPSDETGLSGTLVLSPHADDAALSVGASLMLGVFRPPVRMATLFGRSNYALGAFHSDWREVTRLRRSEDEAFSSTIGLVSRFLDLPEASLRPDLGHGGVWARDISESFPEPPELMQALRSLLSEFTPALLVAPLGLGHHKDHLLVQRAARRLANGGPRQIVFYEDLPYAERLTVREITRHAKAVDARLEPRSISITEVLDRKIRALDCYSSQLEREHIDATRRHALGRSGWWSRLLRRPTSGGACERLWTVGAGPGLL